MKRRFIVLLLFCGVAASFAQETPYDLLEFASPELIYDFDADGSFDLVNNVYSSGSYVTQKIMNFSQSPLPEPLIESNSIISTVCNLNNDNVPDLFGTSYGYYRTNWAFINEEDSYRQIATEYSIWDQNIDGRPDLFTTPEGYNADYKWLLMSGSLKNEFSFCVPNIVSYSDYLSSPNYSAWDIADSISYRSGNPSGVLLPSGGINNAIGKLCCSDLSVDVSPSVDELDVNKDGLPDLLVPDLGAVYYNYGDGKYVSAYIGGVTRAKDLNNDFVLDFIVYDESAKRVTAMVYEGEGVFRNQVLMENMALDPKIFCYDFDRDNDIDILLPFSYAGNDLGAFMAVCENDGDGNFTIHENGYVGKIWEFKQCKDFDNDGYYDLLMLSKPENENSFMFILKGKTGFEFEEQSEQMCISNPLPGDSRTWERYHSEDIDNDGLYEVWRTDVNDVSLGSDIYQTEYATVNTRPAKMDAPVVNYDASNNHIEIGWGVGSDTESSTCDLTYAIRIGSAPGKSDMVFAHATLEGARRNFKEGNMRSDLGKIYNVNSWPEGTYYVSVQAVDPYFDGSPWSDETTFEKSSLSADFAILSLCDSLAFEDGYIRIETSVTESYTVDSLLISLAGAINPSYSYVWDFGCDAEELTKIDEGNYIITYNTEGVKDINLSITDGDGKSFDVHKELIVLANKLIKRSEYYDYRYFADFDSDGDQDLVLEDGLYEHISPGNFSKLGKIFNLSLTICYPLWLDIEKDGDIDMFYNDIHQTNMQDNYLLNSGNQNFIVRVDQPETMPSVYPLMADYDHNGYFDNTPYDLNDGTYTHDNSVLSTDMFPTDAEGFCYDRMEMIVDWNKDGWLDFVSQKIEKYDEYNTLIQKYHPHVVLSNGTRSLSMENVELFDMPVDLDILEVEDFDNDGDFDLLCSKNERLLHILVNDGNNKFDYGVDIVVPENIDKDFYLIDLDNNGFKDLFYEKGYYYFEEGLKMRQPKGPVPFSRLPYVLQLIQVSDDSIPDLPYMGLYNEAKISNERPEAPTNLLATQTDTSMIIRWSEGSDLETPVEQLRYNLSVKKKGESGAESYVISPHNEGKEEAGFLPGKYYSNATQFEIGILNLPVGEYEIQVQSIDLWNAMSDFSEVYTVSISSTPIFDLTSEVCFNTLTSISYEGNTGSEINWNFNGGIVESGNAYGPYEVRWNTSGVKNIVATVDGNSYNSSIYVHPETKANYTIPVHVVAEVPAEINLHQTVSADMDFFWSELYGVAKFDVGDSIGTITFSEEGTVNLGLTISKDGCSSASYSETINISKALPVADINIVSSDPITSKNKITWEISSWPVHATKVMVLKEGSKLNYFDTLAIVNAADGMYVDTESEPEVQSERYRLMASDGFQNFGKAGSIHQTVHVAINRGIGSAYNLIWNLYEGKDISSYKILRGVDEDHMNEIAELSGANQSYTDLNPPIGEDLYQVQIVPDVVGKKGISVTSKGEDDIFSNIADIASAVTIVPAESIQIMAQEDEFVLDETQNKIHLFAELLPGNTSLQSVQWEVISGSTLAKISSSGILSHSFEGQGIVKVRATTIDGSGISDVIDVQVNETIVSYTVGVSVDPSEGGTVTGAGTYNENELVTLGATSNSGYDFVNWTKDGVEVSQNATYSFNVNEDVNFVAHFVVQPASYAIDVSAQPIEGGTVTGAGTYSENELVTLGATSNSGYDFVNWTKDGVEVSQNATYSFSANEDAGFIANFLSQSTEVEVTFQVDLQNEIVAPSGVYVKGSFDNWTSAIKMDNTVENVYSTSMIIQSGTTVDYKFYNGDPSLEWDQYTAEEPVGDCVDAWTNRLLLVPDFNYTIPLVCFNSCEACVVQGTTYIIGASADPIEGGSIAGGGSYDENATVSLTATPNAGFDFVSWTKDGVEVSQNAAFSFTATEDASYIAHFSAQVNQVDITFLVDMQNEDVSTNGVHVIGSFCDWDADRAVVMQADETVYSARLSLNVGEDIQYKFVNGGGNEYSKYEIIDDAACTGQDHNRIYTVPSSSSILPIICFNSCNACVSSNEGVNLIENLQLYPNPSTGKVVLEGLSGCVSTIKVFNFQGQMLMYFQTAHLSELEIDLGHLDAGVYNVVVQSDSQLQTRKLVLME